MKKIMNMNMNKSKVVFWWNIPCAGMMGVLKAYAENVDPTATVVTGELSQSRKSMGWEDRGKSFANHIILADDEWDTEGKRLLDEYSDRIHIFNGITYTDRMRRLINYAIEKNIRFANMSEAYFNLEHGWRKLLKSAYIGYIVPLKARKVSAHSLGAICLSGSSKRDMRQYKRLGFKNVYPFGYYTDDDQKYKYEKNLDGKIHILCPGLIEYYKGVDVLVKALGIIKRQGIDNFVCHITGKGSEINNIRRLIDGFALNANVVLEGVLDSESYDSLLSYIDILVAPGRVEPWGIRINEAIQRDNVVIVSDGIGANTLISESGGGKVFESGNPLDLADKLLPYLVSDEGLAKDKRRNEAFKDRISCLSQAMRLAGYIDDFVAQSL